MSYIFGADSPRAKDADELAKLRAQIYRLEDLHRKAMSENERLRHTIERLEREAAERKESS